VQTIRSAAPAAGVVHHFRQLRADMVVTVAKRGVSFQRQVTALERKIQMHLCLAGLSIAIAKFTHESGFVSSLTPRSGDVGAN
jgi:hypothetical protein